MTAKKAKFFTGWAMDVYPHMSERDIAYHVKRQLDEGANFVWIGHNNPGEVDEHKVEPALSYAVYEAYTNPHHPKHNDAKKIIAAQNRILNYCLNIRIKILK